MIVLIVVIVLLVLFVLGVPGFLIFVGLMAASPKPGSERAIANQASRLEREELARERARRAAVAKLDAEEAATAGE